MDGTVRSERTLSLSSYVTYGASALHGCGWERDKTAGKTRERVTVWERATPVVFSLVPRLVVHLTRSQTVYCAGTVWGRDYGLYTVPRLFIVLYLWVGCGESPGTVAMRHAARKESSQ